MFLTLSKILDLVFAPLLWSLAFGLLAGVLAYRGSARKAWVCGVLSWAAAYLPATRLVAGPLFARVEAFDGRRATPRERYDAVILLGGFAFRAGNDDVELTEGGDRLLRAFELLHGGRASRIVVVAGAVDGPAEADAIGEALRVMGVRDEQLVLGRSSRNTHENALEAKALVTREKLRKLVLVTSAFHMQRALECFHAVGLTPDALATDHQAPTFDDPFEALAPRAATLARSELALRELAGRWVYRLSGLATPLR